MATNTIKNNGVNRKIADNIIKMMAHSQIQLVKALSKMADITEISSESGW